MSSGPVEAALGQHTVIVQNRRQDSDGDWLVTATHAVDGCSVQPAGSNQDDDARLQTTQRFTIYGPPALASARAGDHLRVPAWLARTDPAAAAATVAVAVEGQPTIWPDEHGRPHHVELAAVLVAG